LVPFSDVYFLFQISSFVQPGADFSIKSPYLVKVRANGPDKEEVVLLILPASVSP
jgi:hypothetical protein